MTLQWRDGVASLGKGLYVIRLTYQKNGRRHDTERRIKAASRGDAQARRSALKEALEAPQGWTLRQAWEAFLPSMSRRHAA